MKVRIGMREITGGAFRLKEAPQVWPEKLPKHVPQEPCRSDSLRVMLM